MRSLAWIFIAISFHTPRAEAYSPPSDFIVSRSIKERKTFRSIEWSARITDNKTQSAFKEHVRVEFPSGRMVATYSGLSDEPMGVHEADLSSVSRLGRFWIGVALEPNGARVRSSLSELGVLPGEATESKLVRTGKSLMWGWGEGARVLFGKDTFLASGYMNRADGESDSLIFESFMLAGNQLQVPKIATVTSEGFSYRFEIRTVKVDVPNKAPPASAARVDSPLVKGWVKLVR
jgi:hypothetical protein